MIDETNLWRPRPPSQYAPTGKVLSAATKTLARTGSILRRAGRVEAACLWLGELDDAGNGRVMAIVVPSQVNRPRNYSVTGEAMLEVAALARQHGWTVVGAIHSHPGSSVEHSTYDDQMTPSRRAISIISPSYGRWAGPWPQGLGVHEYFDRYWHLLSDEHARLRVRLTGEPEAAAFDLR
jgi:proteasome lid subunit RPN8/RPN11